MRQRIAWCLALLMPVLPSAGSRDDGQSASAPRAGMDQATATSADPWKDVNNRIRREKFDTVLPEVMRKNRVAMWMHVMREGVTDPFGAEELGSTAGVFVFTDRGRDRIERAILERRWGDSFAFETWRVDWDTRTVEEAGAYDIIGDPVLVKQAPGGIMTEYDYRFKGLRAFVEERDPQSIAVNYKLEFGPYPTTTRAQDGLSHTDYLLLARELGPKYSSRIVSSERVMMDYIIRKVPSEIDLLKTLRQQEEARVKKAIASVKPGITRNRDVGLNVFRRRGIGVSQRGRTPGHENVVIQGGDILAAPSQGMYAYVLRKEETEPPPDVKKIWGEYRKVDKILMEEIRSGLTPRQIVRNYKARFEKEGFIVRDDQLQLVYPREDFGAYTAGYDPTRTQLAIDCHGMGKGARQRPFENYFGPRIGSNGPEWTWDIPLPPQHHLVLEYFIYMPWPSKDQPDPYVFWWDHEEAIATDRGVEYLSATPKDLYLIKSGG